MAHYIAPDGKPKTTTKTGWCSDCTQRLPIAAFRWRKPVKETHSPLRYSRCRKCEVVRVKKYKENNPEYVLKWHRHSNKLRDDSLRVAKEERALDKSDPLVLAKGDPKGIELLKTLLKEWQSNDVETATGMPTDSCSKYLRGFRHLQFKHVDKILCILGRQDELDSFDFKRHSERRK